jgi:hypothetical protein
MTTASPDPHMHATEQKIADKITSLGYKKNIIRSMGKNA